MEKLLYIIIGLLAVACGSKSQTDDCVNSHIVEDIADVDSISSSDSLMSWTIDTIKRANMPLVLLMDSLYRFVRSDEFHSNNVNDNILWLNDYRQQLCSYYERNNLGIDTISSFAKADSVIQIANRLWKLDADYSTMGMIINNDIKRTRVVFQHYNEFSKLLYLCVSKEEMQDALRAEFDAWGDLENKISSLCANLIDLGYCGGSGAGVERTSAYLQIIGTHIQLYKKESNWIKHDGDCETQGVYPECAKQLLITCCNIAYRDNYCNEYALEHDYYKQLANDTKRLIKELSPTIDKWLRTRSKWIILNCNGWNENLYNLNSGEVLLKLSNIICLN